MEQNKIQSDGQYGFRKKQIHIFLALLEMIEKITNVIDIKNLQSGCS